MNCRSAHDLCGSFRTGAPRDHRPCRFTIENRVVPQTVALRISQIDADTPTVRDHIRHIVQCLGITIGIGKPLERIENIVVEFRTHALTNRIVRNPKRIRRAANPNRVHAAEFASHHRSHHRRAVIHRVVRKRGVPHRITPALLPRGNGSAPAIHQRRVCSIHAGIEISDKRSLPGDAQFGVHTICSTRANSRGKIQTIQRIAWWPSVFNHREIRLQRLAAKILADGHNVAPWPQRFHEFLGCLNDKQVFDPVSSISAHCTHRLGIIQFRAKRRLSQRGIRLEGGDDFPVTRG